jgi:hypothetical protein
MLCNEKLHASSNVRVIISRRMRLASPVACMEELKSGYKIYSENLKGKQHLGNSGVIRR